MKTGLSRRPKAIAAWIDRDARTAAIRAFLFLAIGLLAAQILLLTSP
ncbi:MAG: hypothetical protein VX871_11255 [Pseudomonadota bacterium]|nr:hypothetical protein [Pseudomonadota bacterium]